MLRLRIMSDLHLAGNSKFTPQFTEEADVAALLGDIAPPNTEAYRNLLQHLSNTHKRVYVVFGNHEYYSSRGYSMAKIKEMFLAMIADLPQVRFLDNDTDYFPIGEDKKIRFIGSTLWSKILPSREYIIKSRLNDYAKIWNQNGENITPADTVQLHRIAVNYLETELNKDLETATIILTHHCPLLNSIVAAQYYGNEINSAFCSDLEYLMVNKVLAWCYGHVHVNVPRDYTVKNTLIATNMLGYRVENLVFDPNYIIKFPL